MDLLGPLTRTAAGNEHLLVIVDRFSKMTRAIPLEQIDAESIAAAFLDFSCRPHLNKRVGMLKDLHQRFMNHCH